MKTLVLLRHGESVWNVENRFTGWTDVDLAPRGVQEAHEAGRLLREGGYTFDVAFTSLLKRAIRTLWITLDEMDLLWSPSSAAGASTSATTDRCRASTRRRRPRNTGRSRSWSGGAATAIPRLPWPV